MRLLVSFIVLAGLFLASWAIWGESMEDRFSVAGSVAAMESAGGWAWAAGAPTTAPDAFGRPVTLEDRPPPHSR